MIAPPPPVRFANQAAKKTTDKKKHLIKSYNNKTKTNKAIPTYQDSEKLERQRQLAIHWLAWKKDNSIYKVNKHIEKEQTEGGNNRTYSKRRKMLKHCYAPPAISNSSMSRYKLSSSTYKQKRNIHETRATTTRETK
jgi:hypothetical protein